MIKKLVLAVAVAAVAVSFAPTASFAKKMHHKGHHKGAPCTMGTMASGKANSMGWAPVSMCGMDGKMYPTMMMCYGASSLCPPSM